LFRPGKNRSEKAANLKEKYLSQDTRDHSKIAFAAVRTVTVIEHTLLDLLSDAEGRMDLVRSTEAAAVETCACRDLQRESSCFTALPSWAVR
jgi:hypothetical protein